MEKVFPLFKPFKNIFYLKIFELGRLLFGMNQVWMILNLFEIIWILGLNSFKWSDDPTSRADPCSRLIQPEPPSSLLLYRAARRQRRPHPLAKAVAASLSPVGTPLLLLPPRGRHWTPPFCLLAAMKGALSRNRCLSPPARFPTPSLAQIIAPPHPWPQVHLQLAGEPQQPPDLEPMSMLPLPNGELQAPVLSVPHLGQRLTPLHPFELQGRYTIIIVHRSLDANVKNRCAAPVCHLIAAPPPWWDPNLRTLPNAFLSLPLCSWWRQDGDPVTAAPSASAPLHRRARGLDAVTTSCRARTCAIGMGAMCRPSAISASGPSRLCWASRQIRLMHYSSFNLFQIHFFI
jgi:hypothetical protein